MKNPFGTVRKCLQAHTGLFAIRDEEGFRLAEDLTEVKADFLVTAINNHEKLLEVCRAFLVDFVNPRIAYRAHEIEVIRKAKAAFAAAKEK